MKSRKRVVYCVLTLLLFVAEVFIEKCFWDGFIRNRFGDVLVVILLYTLIRCFIPEGKKHLPLGIFLFAAFVEFLQLIDILGILGLKQYQLLRIIAGSQFDFGDIICYAVGCALCYLDALKEQICKLLEPALKRVVSNISTKLLLLWLVPCLLASIIQIRLDKGIAAIVVGFLWTVFYFGCILWPPIGMTIVELFDFIRNTPINIKKRRLDYFVIVLGMIDEFIYLGFLNNVCFGVSYQEQLYGRDLHSPIQHVIYIFVFMALFMLGRCLFVEDEAGKNRIQEVPPLIAVFAIAFLYIGVIFSVVFTYQISTVIETPLDGFLLLLPVNMLLMTTHVLLNSILNYKKDEQRSSKIDSIPILSKINRLVENAKFWPIYGVIFMLPVLAVLLIILILFGQGPNALIKMWTETSDFALSQQVSPQNISYDEHYLCTVAAGGHRKVVKPKRRGIRHGHEVIVNRQLCVANAFEQILEIHTPKFHKKLRHFYDTYGFPVAKLIKSKFIADIIWFIMKPLEWIFVFVLYATEVHPEDRIALQYTGKNVEDFGCVEK